MTDTPINPVILCGGAGTRLWPVSRTLYPKQFLALGGDTPLVVATAERTQHHAFAAPLLICNAEHRFLVLSLFEQAGITPQAILLEPQGRNTALAAAIAALYLQQMSPDRDPLVLLLPADHLIPDHDRFRSTILEGVAAAMAGHIVTYGIAPTRPETGYGYIEPSANSAGGSAKTVARFVEKPDQKTAEDYLASGAFLWNSGIFLFAAQTMITALEQTAPDTLAAAKAALADATPDLEFHRLGEPAYQAAPDISLDHAVMEKIKNTAVVPAAFAWSDIGSWATLWEHATKDKTGNAATGNVVIRNCQSSYIHSETGMLTVVSGLDNVAVIVTEDAVLVTDRARAEDVKQVVQQLAREQHIEQHSHRTVHRPWGHYKSLITGDGFQVKEIGVKPGANLSLQYHHHRSEHWVVVEGIASIQVGDSKKTLEKNQSIYVPVGEKHRLSNEQTGALRIIEVQCGDYLGEDDIVRLEDDYNRDQDKP